MDGSDPFDVAVIGGGIVGMATAMALLENGVRRVVVLEAEDRVAPHQTGHNSGVIHSGLYYRPGSLKAANCVRGRKALLALCEEEDVPFEICGKLVVATDPKEVAALDELERRGRANGLAGLERVRAGELREYEPHVTGIDGLWVPGTGICDFAAVTRAMARRVKARDGEVRLDSRVLGAGREDGVHLLETASGPVRARFVVGCAGLQSDRVARLCGVQPRVRIVPFRGEYYDLTPDAAQMVRNLIYPVPDPGFPFLGVHLTRMIHGGAEAGPNAVLSFRREGYSRTAFSVRDAASTLTFGGFWKLAGRYWKTGLAEQWRSLNKGAFVRSVRRLVPGLRDDQLVRGGAGVRAQALDPSGFLLDDFAIVRGERMVHVLNAPSPAATASIAIGRTIAGMVDDEMRK